jgi:D-alanine transaminase
MSRIAYVNGHYLPLRQAAVGIEDRGYLFADGVYEVCVVRNRRLIDEGRHMSRLARSLGELRIRWPLAPSALGVVMREVIRRNRVTDGVIYVQITRGSAGPRSHAFPPDSVSPGIVVTARNVSRDDTEQMALEGIAVTTTSDNRWDRVDIKTVSLLPNVLAKQAAIEAGATEAWFVDRNGHITEGASSNAWILTEDSVLVTRAAEDGILRGITREVVLDLIRREGIRFEERSFTVSEALVAREAFISSAGNLIMPVVRIDGQPIGGGKPGELSLKLRRLFFTQADESPLSWTPGAIAHGPNLSDKEASVRFRR